MKEFMDENFLLDSPMACQLYHEYAANMPVYDYHCHLPAQQIAEDKQFSSLTEAWLAGDHYKWRAMRTHGVDERYCTGDASEREKFEAWAKTVPFTLRNPLYHWTHLELKRYFGINGLLDESSWQRIYKECNDMLASPDFRCRGLLRKMNVKLVCTTEDPLDDLKFHQQIGDDGFEIKVHTAFRPDKAMMTEDMDGLIAWIGALREKTGMDIGNFGQYIEAIRNRHDFFHSVGCRLSDHGLETMYAENYTPGDIDAIFDKILKKQVLTEYEHLQFKSAMLYEFALMDHEKGWVQQFHLGALRNNNSRLLQRLGPDTGFDSIGDFEVARPLSRFLDRMDANDQLAKTILYNLNPRDNELIATMIGNFQDGSVPGKIQFGSGWWFLDQKDGMQRQMNALSALGLLAHFVGMLTDSRSFLSYPRHEYFRRILCSLIGGDVENGLIPKDMDLLGRMVQDVCYNNAKNYFPMEL